MRIFWTLAPIPLQTYCYGAAVRIRSYREPVGELRLSFGSEAELQVSRNNNIGRLVEAIPTVVSAAKSGELTAMQPPI